MLLLLSSRAIASAACFILAVEITDSSKEITLAATATGLNGGDIWGGFLDSVGFRPLDGVLGGLVWESKNTF